MPEIKDHSTNACYMAPSAENKRSFYGLAISDHIRRLSVGTIVGEKNICVIQYCKKGMRERPSSFASAMSDVANHSHSEVEAFAQLRRECANGDTIEVLSLYTDRAPCQQGAGMANCDKYLFDMFNGSTLPAGFTRDPAPGSVCIIFPFTRNTPVYFSYHYPSSGVEEVDRFIQQQIEQDVVDQDDINNKYFKGMIKDWMSKERAYARQELRANSRKDPAARNINT